MAADTVYEGPITMTRKGIGFFAAPAASSEASAKEDLIIPPEWTNHALAGDIVKVVSAGSYHDPSGRMPPRAAGKVVEIVSRARETFVGTLIEENGLTLLAPDYKKMYVPIVIRDRGETQIGYKVLVRLEEWAADKEYPLGTIREVIGKAGVHETEMRALALGQGFSSDFPSAVAAEAKRLELEGQAMLVAEVARLVESGRRDFRFVPTCTIDPIDAKDFDDALSVQQLPDGTIEVGVHIADVSFFVKPGTALDTEATLRATSVYLVDRTIPMLPEVLSNDLCSLKPDEDRLAVSAVFKLDTEANVKDVWFGETVIHSNKRFTYENAQEVLDAGSGTLHEELSLLHTLAQKIRTSRQAKGAIEFDTAEVKVELDGTGKPIAIHLKERKGTNLLIEDFMLLANEAVAKYLSELTKNGGPHFASLYRVHDTPDADRIENLAHFLRVLGYHLKTSGGKVSGAELNKLLEEVKGKPEEYLIKTATLRSMSKAVYATKNIGHFGLGFDFYTHFTSPIRRYPDLVIHRLIKAHAGGAAITAQEMQEFDALALHASEREVAASDAERDSIKMKQVEFLAGRIDEEFDAVISGVTDRGLYVEEQTTNADGMINIRAVGDDYFEYDEKYYRLIGRRTKKVYQLGDPIRVKLIAARIPEKELDFVPVI
ncbi:ribonuclease R [Candidatus Kaiserbacteria bacterium RIFCSPLOWO2_01_FULL_52_12b]|uniref:Ribonuclease R n=1 Tax=Candidatus Kaiserbacteria bacterium RIFCSPLOWO2_01_FULL_52_12b TaxID=1798509 RepID=A0A1F6EWY2_9BACT|nr:MAG: ribonuclease R [Candidatus Kaiserbacteria bacterium RIFCSPLOWO2_01_FULL_52_12b]